MRIGGSQSFSNDLQVDGSPSGISVKTGYVPSPDMVQEVTVLQNAVDAEYGHSSGSSISVVLKSGTNEFHGNAFYQGRYPWANAVENRIYRDINKTRNHMMGATLGNPILKNKLFNFFGFEMWKRTDPGFLYNTVPTDLQRQGNFSQTFTDEGQLRLIYDPWSTKTAPDGRSPARLSRTTSFLQTGSIRSQRGISTHSGNPTGPASTRSIPTISLRRPR